MSKWHIWIKIIAQKSYKYSWLVRFPSEDGSSPLKIIIMNKWIKKNLILCTPCGRKKTNNHGKDIKRGTNEEISIICWTTPFFYKEKNEKSNQTIDLDNGDRQGNDAGVIKISLTSQGNSKKNPVNVVRVCVIVWS